MNILLTVQRIIMYISSIIVIVSLSLTVFFRYILQVDLFGVEEILIIPIFALYFLGATYGTYEKSHITADLLDTYVKNKKVLNWIRTFTTFISFAASAVFSFWAFQYFLWSYDKQEKTPGWHIPLYIPHGIVLIGFLLMSVYLLIHLINHIKLIKVGVGK